MYKACGAFQSNLTNMAMNMNYKIYVWQMSHMKLKNSDLFTEAISVPIY